VLGTQTVATLIAVYGLFMHPLGWGWAGFVWAYAIAWALLNDRVKLLAYRILDPTKAPLPSGKPKVDAPLDLKPEISTRAYDLFEKRGRADGKAPEDWAEAEREVRKEHEVVTP
jgi:H+-transporting ATPase